MTGYGRDVIKKGSTTITIEMSSVNHRFLDISMQTPRSLLYMEDKIKKIIQQKFTRGRIEVFVNIEGEQFVNQSLTTNWKLLNEYMEIIQQIKDKYNLAGDIPLTMISSLPEIISVQKLEDKSQDIDDLLLDCMSHVCERVLATRKKEANYIIKDIKERMATIQQTVSLLNDTKHVIIEDYRKRVSERIEDFLLGEVIDENRLHQEIAYLIERGDITEEIIRLFGHIEHFFNVLQTGGAIGRKLDFIIQEMHRETNTIGSKSMDTEISKKVVFLKGEIEKIKEQIQNIE